MRCSFACLFTYSPEPPRSSGRCCTRDTGARHVIPTGKHHVTYTGPTRDKALLERERGDQPARKPTACTPGINVAISLIIYRVHCTLYTVHRVHGI